MGSYIGKDGRSKLFKHEFQEYNGRRFYKKSCNGYFYSKWPDNKYMHRYVWECCNGPIPEGHHIHHINHNVSDNRIENLECIEASEHTKHHNKTNSWIGSKENREQILEAGKLAKEWHGSEEGKKWHSEHGKKTWENRVSYTKKCEFCGEQYQTFYKNRSKFCGQACKANYRRWSKTGFLPDKKPVKRG